MYQVLIFFGAALAIWLLKSLWDYYFAPHGKFWRLMGKYPELGLALLSEEPDVIIQPPKCEVPKAHMGPFWVMDRLGMKWKIYINRATIDEVEKRVLEKIRSQHLRVL
jgi:hypothetical protein